CSECGKITDFQYPALEEVEHLAGLVTDYEVSHHRWKYTVSVLNAAKMKKVLREDKTSFFYIKDVKRTSIKIPGASRTGNFYLIFTVFFIAYLFNFFLSAVFNIIISSERFAFKLLI